MKKKYLFLAYSFLFVILCMIVFYPFYISGKSGQFPLIFLDWSHGPWSDRIPFFSSFPPSAPPSGGLVRAVSLKSSVRPLLFDSL